MWAEPGRADDQHGACWLCLQIYPSEFGEERLKAEQSQGPMELKALPDDSEDDTEEER